MSFYSYSFSNTVSLLLVSMIFLSSLINLTASAFQIRPGELITDSSLVTITQHARVYTARSLVKLRSSLDWIHLPKMCLKIFDKEGCRLGLTLQMQKNNRVGIHHGELNSRLVWESVNKTRPALWRILEEIAYCFGSSCMRWATTPDALPSENR